MSYLLFADDNEDMRLMLRDLFRSSGHEVCLAEDGLAALASIREREPDLVILDHSMPGNVGVRGVSKREAKSIHVANPRTHADGTIGDRKQDRRVRCRRRRLSRQAI